MGAASVEGRVVVVVVVVVVIVVGLVAMMMVVVISNDGAAMVCAPSPSPSAVPSLRAWSLTPSAPVS